MRYDPGPLPPGYVAHRIGPTWLVLDAARAEDLVRLRLADPSVREALFTRAAPGGRGTVPRIRVSADLRMALRRYQHGGALARLTGSWFLGSSRALQELAVTARAERFGAPVPHVLCLTLWPALGPFWCALIGTAEETRSRDLLQALLGVETRAERHHLLGEVGRAIRKLHDAGVEHRDLQLRNILVRDSSERRVVLIDLDRARFHPRGTMPVSRRAANLGRLVRSTAKAGLLGTLIDRRALAASVAGYCAHDRRLRAELRSQLRWESIKLAVHRLSYPLRAGGRPLRAAAPHRPA